LTLSAKKCKIWWESKNGLPSFSLFMFFAADSGCELKAETLADRYRNAGIHSMEERTEIIFEETGEPINTVFHDSPWN